MPAEGPGATHTPFKTPVARVGIQGLQLNKPLDALSVQELSRMSNLFTTGNGDLTSRPGQTRFANGAGALHSVRRLNDPKNATHSRFWGIGSSWWRGQTGGLLALEGGFSGKPLTLVPIRPSFSGESWMLAADSLKMRKASLYSPSLPIGLPAPLTAPTTAIATLWTTPIAAFDAGDGTDAAAWVAFAGPSSDGTGAAGVPALSDVVGVQGNGVKMVTAPGTVAAHTGYASVMCKAIALNLNKLQGGAQPSTDQDFIHIWLRMENVTHIDSIRLYFVCSAFSDAALMIPGTGASNQSAYLWTFRPSDYAQFVFDVSTNPLTAAARARSSLFLHNGVLVEGFRTGDTAIPRGSVAPIVTQQPLPAVASVPGEAAWTDYGRIGLPVRKADFLKIGSAGDAGTDWSTITGVYIVVQTVDTDPTDLPVGVVTVTFDDAYLTGGHGPDTSEPGAQQYDYRVVNYDPRTGARSNGSPLLTTPLIANAIQPGSIPLDALRQDINITPAAYGDANIRQEAYRRGGSLTDNWRYVGVNTSDGGLINDALTDDALLNADTLPTNHFQPVPTVDYAGAAVYAQPVPIVFGPFENGIVCALGDPYRPGHLYSCIAGEPDHWPATEDYIPEVCSASEELMNGCVWGGQGFVLSRLRGYTVYANPNGVGIIVAPSACQPGLAARWGFCTGPGGIYYVAKDNIRVTTGDASEILSDQIRPLFNALTVNGYLPIDWTVEDKIRLSLHNLDLWFLYQDTGGTVRCLVYSLIYKYWRPYTFANPPLVAYGDETEQQDLTATQLVLGAANANAYWHTGFTDDGTAISFSGRTGAWDFGLPRDDKLLGDLILDANLNSTVLTVQTLLDMESITNASQTVTGGAGRARYTLDPFGIVPQKARNIAIDFSGTAGGGSSVTLSLLGVSVIEQPDVTLKRATDWHSPTGKPEQAYCWGVSLDCDTRDSTLTAQTKTVVVEGDIGGSFVTLATLSVSANGRRKLWFSWAGAQVMGVRLRPTDTNQWLLYAAEWLATPEPPTIAVWDTNWENKWDTYYTGLDLECNTYGAAKTVHVLVDGAEVAGSPFTVTTATRLVTHLTFTPARGHVYRFYTSDANAGQLYAWRWHTVEEPSEQTNWNQNFDDLGNPGQKYITGIILETDTANHLKLVNVEIDGTVVETLSVQTNGRLTTRHGFANGPYRGYVVRLLPTDAFPGRLYNKQWLFEKEPESTARGQVENFDDLGDPGDKWIAGILLECDTLNVAKSIWVEIDGIVQETLSVTANGRTTQNVNFVGGPYRGKVVRLLPQGTGYLQLWAKKWLFDKEPDETAGFAVLNYEDLKWPGEKYVSGIIVEADTKGAAKTIHVEIDNVLVETLTVQTTVRGTQQFHFASGPYRSAKVVRLYPDKLDTNPGRLYAVQWLFENEPADTAGFGVLNFEDLKWVGEKYLSGVMLEIDTHGVAKTVQVEVDGVVKETLTVNTTQRMVQAFNFPGGPYTTAAIVRLKPTDTNPGKLYGIQWLWENEPPNTAGFGVLNFSDLGWIAEKYLTGVIVECDTFCGGKYMYVEIDGVIQEVILLQTPQRQVVQVHFPSGPYAMARVVRLLPADTITGKLYNIQWLFENEPIDNAGLGVQNWSILGYPTDKYVKGILLECDTHGLEKTVLIEGDGNTLIAALKVQTTSRQVVELTFPQVLARVVRLRATDAHPGKLYTAQWLFDLEPLALARWETQLLDFGFPGSGWGMLLSCDVCYRSTFDATWTITVYNSLGTLLNTLVYSLPSTGGAKRKRYVPFDPNKGVLYKFVFATTDNSPSLTLYQEESRLRIKGWSTPGISEIHGFGNDDLDVTRNMREAAIAASRSGGGS